MKILIVEDEIELAQNMELYLSKEKFLVTTSHTYADAMDNFYLSRTIAWFDIMFPDGNGPKLLQFIKANKIKSNILITSAKNSIDDKVKGLDLGADDYLTKPFHSSELNARLKAIYRRNNLDGRFNN